MDGMITLTIGTTSVLAAKLAECPRAGRAVTERAAVNSLAKAAFGPSAQLAHDPLGAPFIEGFEGHISVSHGAGYALLAIDREHRIGIDCEAYRPQLQRVASKFLSPGELPVHAASPRALLRAWTIKEAIFKALGDPTLTISQISLPAYLPEETPTEIHLPQGTARIIVQTVPLPAAPLAALATLVTLASVTAY